MSNSTDKDRVVVLERPNTYDFEDESLDPKVEQGLKDAFRSQQGTHVFLAQLANGEKLTGVGALVAVLPTIEAHAMVTEVIMADQIKYNRQLAEEVGMALIDHSLRFANFIGRSLVFRLDSPEIPIVESIIDEKHIPKI